MIASYTSTGHWSSLFFSLFEVGRLDVPRSGSNYDTGQLFLHKVDNRHPSIYLFIYLSIYIYISI